MQSDQFFFFYAGLFSQWEPCHFEIAGISYNRAEQFMMAGKASLFKDDEILKQILQSNSAREQQKLGKLVKNFVKSEWDAVARNIVYEGNYAKFTQNQSFKESLLATGDRLMVETSPIDKIWGIGLGERGPKKYDRNAWQGTNWLGEVLTKVREDIKAGIVSTEFNWS